MLAAYSSPETRPAIPPARSIPRASWAAIYVRQYVIGYNTASVKPGEAPRDWSDLLAAALEGQARASTRTRPSGTPRCSITRAATSGTAFMRALARQEPQLRRGHSLFVEAARRGRLSRSRWCTRPRWRRRRRPARRWTGSGRWIRSSRRRARSRSRRSAPHPAAARLFVDFLLSAEGQAPDRQPGPRAGATVSRRATDIEAALRRTGAGARHGTLGRRNSGRSSEGR